METKVCHKCLQEKPLEEFPWKSIVTRKRQAVCKTCTAQRSADWYENNKDHHRKNVYDRRTKLRLEAREYVLNYLSTQPCENCRESDPVVLEFHHIGEKGDEVSTLLHQSDSLIRVIEEISRCQVLCSNCHKRVTTKERGWFKSRSV
jgi:hypothetical protein